jgi:hypothetical protein
VKCFFQSTNEEDGAVLRQTEAFPYSSLWYHILDMSLHPTYVFGAPSRRVTHQRPCLLAGSSSTASTAVVFAQATAGNRPLNILSGPVEKYLSWADALALAPVCKGSVNEETFVTIRHINILKLFMWSKHVHGLARTSGIPQHDLMNMMARAYEILYWRGGFPPDNLASAHPLRMLKDAFLLQTCQNLWVEKSSLPGIQRLMDGIRKAYRANGQAVQLQEAFVLYGQYRVLRMAQF